MKNQDYCCTRKGKARVVGGLLRVTLFLETPTKPLLEDVAGAPGAVDAPGTATLQQDLPASKAWDQKRARCHLWYQIELLSFNYCFKAKYFMISLLVATNNI